MIGAGGVMIPPEGYLERVQEICREREVLLVLDEVITGFGRIGEWFATGRFGLSPDLITGREGDHLRLHPARRRDRLGARGRAVLGGGDDERVPPRLHVLRARDRLRGRRSRTST